jgi:phospholipid-binding lipoprotein MlaA
MLKTICTRLLPSMAAFCLVAGCASTWNPKTPEDPYESYNRAVFSFNLGVDRHIYRPIAHGYDFITPHFVQNRIRNFFSNVNQVPVIVNDTLQANMPWLVSDIGRLVVNTTLGLGGLFDPATALGMKKHAQDFGLTMAVWGVQKSPYFIFPFLPPGTARDFFGMALDGYAFSVWTYIDPAWVGYSARGLDFIQLRAGLLSLDKSVDEAFDPYIFLRDSYLQNRHSKIQRVLHPREDEFSSGPALEEQTTTVATVSASEPNDVRAVWSPSALSEHGSSASAVLPPFAPPKQSHEKNAALSPVSPPAARS